MAVILDILFICCSKELLYVSQLAAVMVYYADLHDEQLTSHSLIHVSLQCQFDRNHLLTNLEY